MLVTEPGLRAGALAGADVLVVDLTADAGRGSRRGRARPGTGPPTLAFYSHVEADVRSRRPRHAGFDLVVPALADGARGRGAGDAAWPSVAAVSCRSAPRSRRRSAGRTSRRRRAARRTIPKRDLPARPGAAARRGRARRPGRPGPRNAGIVRCSSAATSFGSSPGTWRSRSAALPSGSVERHAVAAHERAHDARAPAPGRSRRLRAGGAQHELGIGGRAVAIDAEDVKARAPALRASRPRRSRTRSPPATRPASSAGDGVEADRHRLARAAGSPPAPATIERSTAVSLGTPVTPTVLPSSCRGLRDRRRRDHRGQRPLDDRHDPDDVLCRARGRWPGRGCRGSRSWPGRSRAA